MTRYMALCAAVLCGTGLAQAQTIDRLSSNVTKYLRAGTPKTILEHVAVIDGTGAPSIADRNIVIENGRIAAISAGADIAPADGVTVLDLRGHSVIPGIVGMHGHLWFYPRPNLQPDGDYDGIGLATIMHYSAPRLYLANGVTTMRTAGAIAPLADAGLKEAIEQGRAPGPHLDVTGPYFQGPETRGVRKLSLSTSEDARNAVAFLAEHGVTSFKAYAEIRRGELRAVVAEAHRRGLKVMGHLCSVTYREAADIGIDSLEHGFFVDTELDPDKKPDRCSDSRGDYTLENMTEAQAKDLIAYLIRHRVAVTSTLPSTAFGAPEFRRPLKPAALAALSPNARDAVLLDWKRVQDGGKDSTKLLRRDMQLEREFAAAGGLLIAGADPVGLFNLVPGYADHREIELLVDAGFKPVEAIKIATLNGAIFLGRQNSIGSIAIGKNADLVVVKGDPASNIADIENVEIVFKDGAGYDSAKLLEAAKGHYGEF